MEDIKYWQRIKANAIDTIQIADERIKALENLGSGKPKLSTKRAISDDVLTSIRIKQRQKRLRGC